jgi:PAS domain S-box-containing protein
VTNVSQSNMAVKLNLTRGLARFVTPAALVGLVVWLSAVSLLAIAVAHERELAVQRATHESERLSVILEENTARTFDGVEIALEGIATYLSTREFAADDPGVQAVMQARLKYLPPVRALFVIGPDGWIRHDTDFPRTPKVSLTDRDYFQQYLHDPGLQHAISHALKSRSGTGWFVASTQRITGPGGVFRGLVVAAVQLDWLSQLYARLQLDSKQTLALLQQDGRLLARFPPADALIGMNFAENEAYAQNVARGKVGTYFTDGPPLGTPRIVSYRALSSQPLVAVLVTPLEAVLAPWHRMAAGAVGAGLVLTLLTCAGVLFFEQRQEAARRAVAHRIAQAEEHAAAQANAKFRAFFEQGCFLSCVLALDGTVLEVNRAGLAACGIERDAVAGRKFWECDWWTAAAANRSTLKDGIAAAVNGASVHSDSAYRLVDGSARLVELVFSPVRDDAGEVLSVAVLGVDITERKYHEERLRALADELANADRLKGEFLATLSHELRNVLAPMQNAVLILERVQAGSAPAVRAWNMLKRQFLQIRHLVDDLLDVSRVNSGKVRLHKEHLDLRQVLESAAEAAQTVMEAAGHRLTTNWPAEPLPLAVDGARMQQVISNLLGNAAKYTTPAGGHIQLNARREGREVLVEVVDDGMGIPADAQARVFDMFHQVDDHLSRSQGGLGIGLSLVQKLVALHGGHVEAFSQGANLGSTFTIYLPIAEAATGTDGAPSATAPRHDEHAARRAGLPGETASGGAQVGQ